MSELPDSPDSAPHSLREVFLASLKLGLIAFGGPIAHLGYFREEFVQKRRWLSDAAYSDLIALCQFLPGPASSQTIFALGLQRRGLPGALLASLGFTLPSAIIMVLFAYGVTSLGNLHQAGWLHGLKLAAVAVVAKAVIGMGRQLCPDLLRISIALTAALALIVFPNVWFQIGIITGGAALGYFLGDHSSSISNNLSPVRNHRIAISLLASFLGLLVLLPLLASTFQNLHLALFDSFYRSGSLVFGGGHVVLPLLRSEVIPQHWVSEDNFLAGYGAAQALPGPLFSFAAYLGTIAHGGPQAWLGGIFCLIVIFLPGWLLIAGTLPFWEKIRSLDSAQASLRGANAAVVGILLAALYNPVITSSIHSLSDAGQAAIGLILLQWTQFPPWLLVILAATVAQISNN